jgi:hypothetical protein
MSAIREEDRAAAHDIARGVYRCNDPHMNKQHSDTCDAIAQAIADARETERQAFVDGLTCDGADTDECTHFLCRDVMAIARRSP